jgi:predicted DNA-binding protein
MKSATYLRDYTYSVRIPPELRNRLLAVTDKTKIPHTNLVMTCMESVCDYVEQHGALTMPFDVVPRPDLKKMQSHIRELEKQLKIKKR